MLGDFVRDPSVAYLNSGTHSLAPRPVLDAVIAELRAYERNPTAALFHAWGRLWEVHRLLGAFFKARPQDLYLRANVTDALNAAILGFRLEPGGEILHSDLEYGAIANLCRFRAERDGRTLRAFGIGHEDPVRDVTAALGPETRMVVLSHVMAGTGLALPIEEIARETRGRGVVLVIDGAHALGALPVDFSKLDDVDAYGANLHKWMMGPKGTGFGWVPERNHSRIDPLSAGWLTFEQAPAFRSFGGGDRFAERMLMQGCHDFSPYLAIPAMIDFWEAAGPDRIRARIRELQAETDRLVREKLGWERVSPPAGPRLGPLLTYRLPERWVEEAPTLMPRLLTEARVQVMVTLVRGRWAMRLSPHVYVDEAEIARGISALESFHL